MKVCTKCKVEKAKSEFGLRDKGARVHTICRPCLKKYSKDRYHSTKEERKERETARFAKYREDNREKVRERSRTWARNNIETNTKWMRENPEKRKEVARNYVRRNSEKLAEYRANNIERIKELSRLWRQNNKPKKTAANAKREAMKRRAVPVYANHFFIEEAYSLAALRNELHGFEWHVDHIVPLIGKIDRVHVVCGLHVEHNLRVIPGKENMKKGSRYWPDMP